MMLALTLGMTLYLHLLKKNNYFTSGVMIGSSMQLLKSLQNSLWFMNTHIVWNNGKNKLPEHKYVLFALPGVGNVGKLLIDSLNKTCNSKEILKLQRGSITGIIILLQHYLFLTVISMRHWKLFLKIA